MIMGDYLHSLCHDPYNMCYINCYCDCNYIGKSELIPEAAQTCGHAAEMGEEAKHSRNDEACALRGWSCIPLVVEVFGEWGNEAINVLLAISKKVATQLCRPLNEVVGHLQSPQPHPHEAECQGNFGQMCLTKHLL